MISEQQRIASKGACMSQPERWVQIQLRVAYSHPCKCSPKWGISTQMTLLNMGLHVFTVEFWNDVEIYLYLVFYFIRIYLFIFIVCLCLGWLMLSHRSSGADKQGEAMALSRACIQTAPKSQRIWWRSKWNHATSNRKEGGIWANQPCLRCVSASAELERAVCRHHHLQLKNVASADELGWWWLGKWWWWW